MSEQNDNALPVTIDPIITDLGSLDKQAILAHVEKLADELDKKLVSPVPIKLIVIQKSGAVIGPDQTVTLTVDGEPVKMKKGYMFMDPKLDVTHRGKKITPETLTHAAAVQMIKEQSLFFRYNMDGGFYPLDHSYWK